MKKERTRERLFAGIVAGWLGMTASTASAIDVSVVGGDGSAGGGLGGRVIPGLVRFDVDYLHTSRGDTDIYSADLMFAPTLPIVHPQVGVRYQYQSSWFGSGSGLGFGGSFFLDVFPRVQVGVFGFYTPDAATTSQLRSSVDYGAQVKVHVVGGLNVTGGYRIVRSQFEHQGSHDLYRGPMFSADYRF